MVEPDEAKASHSNHRHLTSFVYGLVWIGMDWKCHPTGTIFRRKPPRACGYTIATPWEDMNSQEQEQHKSHKHSSLLEQH